MWGPSIIDWKLKEQRQVALAFTSPVAMEETLKQAMSLQITACSQHLVNFFPLTCDHFISSL